MPIGGLKKFLKIVQPFVEVECELKEWKNSILEGCKVLRLNQEETENMNKSVTTTTETELVILRPQQTKVKGSEGFTGEF